MTYPKIAIIGAGPVGTTLARLLLIKTPSASVTVYEGEQSPNYRSQGGSLDLHTDTGLAAIKEADLWDELLKHARYDGESLKITDKDLKVYHYVQPSKSSEEPSGHMGGHRPEVDRAALRRMLVESLPEGTVQWGHKLTDIRTAKDGRPTANELVFQVTSEVSDNTTKKEVVLSGFDLIVGADGGWSKIRSHALSSTKPFFSGVLYHELNIPDPQTSMPDVYHFVNRGSVFAHADGLRVAYQQMGDGSLNMAVMYRTDNDETWVHDKSKCGFDATDLEETRAVLRGRLQDWHPFIKEGLAQARGRTVPRSLYMLPVGFSWTHRSGITVIGDAAHVMTPFAGEGVNVGMQDARELAKAIQAAGENLNRLDQEVAAFETEMFVRAGRFAKVTDEMLHHWFFTENSPEAVFPKVMETQARFHSQRV